MEQEFSLEFIETWEAHGLLCGIRMGFSGMNGYVQLPQPFKSRRLMDDDINVDVHGGLTYGMDEEGWVGFDTAHYRDIWLADSPDAPLTEMQKAEEHLRSLGHELNRPLYGNEIIWTTEKVKEETERLAENLVQWMSDNPDVESIESPKEHRTRMSKVWLEARRLTEEEGLDRLEAFSRANQQSEASLREQVELREEQKNTGSREK